MISYEYLYLTYDVIFMRYCVIRSIDFISDICLRAACEKCCRNGTIANKLAHIIPFTVNLALAVFHPMEIHLKIRRLILYHEFKMLSVFSTETNAGLRCLFSTRDSRARKAYN